MPVSYKILAENFEAIQIKLEEINKRSEKCGTSGFDLIVEKTEIEPKNNGEVAVYYVVSLRGEQPKINGYSIVAKIDHNDDPSGNSNIIYSINNNDITERDRTRPARCEHCQTKRFRRETFILKNEKDNKTIQIGRTCIKDFIGHNPEKILTNAANYILLEEELKNASKNNTFKMYSWRTVSLKYYLGFVASVIDQFGWVSKQQSYQNGKPSTNYVAWEKMCRANYETEVSDENKDVADAAIAWAAMQDPSKSDFYHNMVTLAKSGYLDFKSCGFAAAIIPTYIKQQKINNIQNSIDFSKSKFVGNVGDRVKIQATVYEKSSGNGLYSPWTRISMIDNAGNIYTTFSTGKFNPDIKSLINISGTIKKHVVYKNTNQTILSRVRENSLTK